MYAAASNDSSLYWIPIRHQDAWIHTQMTIPVLLEPSPPTSW